MKQMMMQSFLIALISTLVAVSADIDWTKVHPINTVPVKMKTTEKNDAFNRVIGGTEAPKNRFPYMVGLIIDIAQADWTGWCGAVLVSEEWALTAGHCLYNNNTVGVTLLLGFHKISQDEAGTDMFSVGAANIKIHEQFNNEDLKNDIAMIKFDKKVTLNDKIKPISLHSQKIPDGSPVSIIGWGQITANNPNRPDILMYINTTVLDLKTCQSKIFKLPTETNICTDGSQGKNSGFGDSGGPLSFTKPDGETVLVGVTSFAAIGFPVGTPSAFTRITSYLDWIEKTSGIKAK